MVRAVSSGTARSQNGAIAPADRAMPILRLHVTLAVSLLLSACAGTAPLLTAPPAAHTNLVLSSAPVPALEQTSHVAGHLDPARRVVYMQMEGGGGLAVGLLLGPLGTAANVGLINARTESDIARMRGRITVLPSAAFSASGEPAVPAGGAPSRTTPYLLIQKVDGQLVVSAAIFVEQDGGQKAWSARYLAQLPGRYSVEQVEAFSAADNEKLAADATRAFADLRRVVRDETPERVGREPRITFKSRLTSMMFMIEMQGALVAQDDERVWIRTMDGILGVRKADVEFALVRS